MARTCSVEDCIRVHLAGGLCEFHYHQRRRERAKAAGCSIPGCSRTGVQGGLCWAHGHRRRTFGDPEATPFRTRQGSAVAFVEAALLVCALTGTDECVLHPFPAKRGYGSTFYRGRKISLHVLVLLLTGRQPPERGGHTRHLCGQKRCLNPRHIKAGTARENNDDSVRLGEKRHGEAHPRAVLTEDAVRTIRAGTEDPGILAQRFGVSRWTITQVRARRSWRHVV